MYNITAKDFLRQINAPHTETFVKEAEELFAKIENPNNVKKHLIQLSDKIKHVDGYIVMSVQKPGCFKIKTISNVKPVVEEFFEIVDMWSGKHEVPLIKEGKKFYLCSR